MTKKKVGRPLIEIDYATVEKLALIHCTQEEIAHFLGVSVDTLLSRKEFVEIYKKGISKGKMSLRRMMWKQAEEGNVTMMIWLSKQLLGYWDRQDVGFSGDGLTVKVNWGGDKNSRNKN